MNRTKAMQIINDALNNDFKYFFKKQIMNINTQHLSFLMNSRDYNLQMTLEYKEQWCDVLCFISPTVLEYGSEAYFEAIKVANYLNWNIKSCGRFYVDTYGDFAYSLRIEYDLLESNTQFCINELETAVDYYSDVFTPVLKVMQGKEIFPWFKEYVDAIWN